MSDAAIQISGLGKRYRYGEVRSANDTLRADLAEWAKGLFKRGNGQQRPQTLHAIHERHLDADPSYFWALRDINLEIKQGEVVGIIGRNGAGKSTLLKVLSRITPPTEGSVTYHGRIASLLEVGTGFHRELTGRENIFLNGSILGMKRSEIARKLDEIIAFAEVEKFMETPVKFYSSGMYVRLAFAVAAHLEPEIMVVDEVLAVGDAAFQKKCLGKMQDVSQHGRTVLFVSHNMAAIKTLCSRAVLLNAGRIEAQGKPEEVIARYLAGAAPEQGISLEQRTDRLGNGALRFTGIRFTNKFGQEVGEVESGDELNVVVSYKCKAPVDEKRMILSLSLWDDLKNLLTLFSSDEMGTAFKPFHEQGTVTVRIPQMLLRAGQYSVKLWASHLDTQAESVYDCVEDAATLHVMAGNFWKTGRVNREGNYSLMPGSISNE
ncbi:MAG: ABC transporter ATP-binding protein [Verrucomicrobia bacterium]|nr:ABC transporter ATP-binding protein [Verrucomicrobiota bacterium]